MHFVIPSVQRYATGLQFVHPESNDISLKGSLGEE